VRLMRRDIFNPSDIIAPLIPKAHAK